jgi:hypothetical protein
MIKIDRTSTTAPLILTDARRAGPRETQRAIAFYLAKLAKKGRGAKGSKAAKKGKVAKAPSFLAYKNPEVKQALELVFRKKCAYCETNFAASGTFPVEHWRPKGRVTLSDGTRRERGYFWLAATWDNLFYSCNDCNGQRELLELPTGIQRLMGKLDRFPLADESKRAEKPGDEIHEAPLLLNPCLDEPADHLEFFDAGEERAIFRPKGDSPKGECSIETFALNRLDLVKARQELLIQLTVLKTQVDQNLLMLDTGPTPLQEQIATTAIKVALADLVRRRAKESQYTALAQREIDAFLTPLLARFALPPLS